MGRRFRKRRLFLFVLMAKSAKSFFSSPLKRWDFFFARSLVSITDTGGTLFYGCLLRGGIFFLQLFGLDSIGLMLKDSIKVDGGVWGAFCADWRELRMVFVQYGIKIDNCTVV